MNTLTGIEAERVVQILKHVSDRLQLLCYVPAYADDSILRELSNGATIELLQRQWEAEDQLKNLNDGAFADMGGRDISVIKAAHRSVRALSRQLLTDPVSLQVLINKKRPEERKNLPNMAHFFGKLPPIGYESSGPESNTNALTNFIIYLNDLSTFIQQRLTTTVEDEAANRTILQDLTEKERHAEESKIALESKFKEITEEKAAVTFGLDSTLKKLELELQDLKSSNKVEIDLIQVEMGEAINKAAVDHDLKMRQLHDHVDGLERQLADVVEKNREEEQRLRKDKTRAEHALNNKIAQYDADMLSRKSYYDKLLEDYTAESEEYRVLCEYFERVDLDSAHEVTEGSRLALVEMREEYGMLFLHRAARKIQALWRGKIVHYNYLKSKKGKKGGDKKDKKGKKK